jgi:hypothetical protein
MDGKQLQLFYLASAFGGICIAVATFLVVPPDFSGLNVHTETKDSRLEGIWRYDLAQMDVGPAPKLNVAWKLRLTYPSHVPKDSTILVEAAPEIIKIHTDAKNWPFKPPTRRDIWRYFEDGAISMELNLPSAKISPEKLSSFSENEVSAWSAYLPVEGLHKGIVIARAEAGEVNLKQNGDTQMTVEVYEPLFSRKNFLSFIGVVLGPLVSIPGMFAFFRERKKDKEEKITIHNGIPRSTNKITAKPEKSSKSEG